MRRKRGQECEDSLRSEGKATRGHEMDFTREGRGCEGRSRREREEGRTDVTGKGNKRRNGERCRSEGRTEREGAWRKGSQ